MATIVARVFQGTVQVPASLAAAALRQVRLRTAAGATILFHWASGRFLVTNVQSLASAKAAMAQATRLFPGLEVQTMEQTNSMFKGSLDYALDMENVAAALDGKVMRGGKKVLVRDDGCTAIITDAGNVILTRVQDDAVAHHFFGVVSRTLGRRKKGLAVKLKK